MGKLGGMTLTDTIAVPERLADRPRVRGFIVPWFVDQAG